MNDSDNALLVISEFGTLRLSAIKAMASACVVVSYPTCKGFADLLRNKHTCLIPETRTLITYRMGQLYD